MFVMKLNGENSLTDNLSDPHNLHQLYSIILLKYLNTNSKVAYKQNLQKYIEARYVKAYLMNISKNI